MHPNDTENHVDFVQSLRAHLTSLDESNPDLVKFLTTVQSPDDLLLGAARLGRPALVKHALQSGAALRHCDETGRSAAMCAASLGDVDSLAAILDTADRRGELRHLEQKDYAGRSLLIHAAYGEKSLFFESCNAECVNMIIQTCGRTTLFDQDRDGNNPLHYLAARPDLDWTHKDNDEYPANSHPFGTHGQVVRYLFEEGADPAHPKKRTRSILGKRLDPNAKNKHGATPLMTAAQHGCAQMIRAVNEYSEIPITKYATDHRRRGMGHYLVQMKSAGRFGDFTETLKALHEVCGGTALLERDMALRSPVHDLAEHFGDQPFIAPSLLEQFAQMSDDALEAPDSRGNTPLHLAVEARQKDAVEYLLHFMADPMTTNAIGETPYQIAERMKETDLMEILQNAEVKHAAARNRRPAETAPEVSAGAGTVEEVEIEEEEASLEQ